jgi:hypothetical protein
MASKEAGPVAEALDELSSYLLPSLMMGDDVRRRGSDGAEVDVEVDDEDVWPRRVDVFAFGVDGEDVGSRVLEEELDVSLAKVRQKGTGSVGGGAARDVGMFAYSMDRRMSHTLPAFELDDVLERLRSDKVDRVSLDLRRRIARRSSVP